MDGICNTCLSRDRRLTPVSAQAYKHLSSLKINWVKVHSSMCWECHGLLHKCVKFRAMAVSAHITLDNLVKCPQLSMDNIQSLSTLSVRHNDSFEEIFFDSTIKTEKVSGLASPASPDGSLCGDVDSVLVKQELLELGVTMELQRGSGCGADDAAADGPLTGEYSMLCETKFEPDEDEESDADTPPEDGRGKPAQKREPPVPSSLSDQTSSRFGNQKTGLLRDQNNSRLSDQTSRCSDQLTGGPGCSSAMINVAPKWQPQDFTVRHLDVSEVHAHLERQRGSERYRRARYKCERCAVTFYTQKLLKGHDVLHSEDQGRFECEFCKQRLSCKDVLDSHTAAHYRLYECGKCDHVEWDDKKMDRHYRSAHDDTPRPCNKCPARFTSDAEMKEHKRLAHATELKCATCGRFFATKHTLRCHVRMQHTKVAAVECQFCHKLYKGDHNLQIHISNEHGDLPRAAHYCAECDLQFKDVYRYRRHLKAATQHAGVKFQCDYCGKKFDNKHYLRVHIERMHIKLHKYKCSVCSERFTTSVYRGRHMRLKHSEQPRIRNKYVCQICEKPFLARTSLDEHMNKHRGVRPFACELCGASFAYKAALYTHNRVHSRKSRVE